MATALMDNRRMDWVGVVLPSSESWSIVHVVRVRRYELTLFIVHVVAS